mmetsp:Transcript_23496/g.50942  ORF Transcript_23496/g.50942 Transcript_23496/m.50942 type:complete len:635 (+) Transcript_23496:69-1973(+)
MSDDPICDHCADALLHASADGDGISVITLDTSLDMVIGVARILEARDALRTLVIVETPEGAPLNSVTDDVPETKLVTCTTASVATYLTTKGADAFVVAVDTIYSNGDCIAKVSSCNVALLAAALDIVPRYCMAPTNKINLNPISGDEYDCKQNSQFSSGHWNPTNDMIPNSFVTGIITEEGIIRKSAGGVCSFDVASFLSADDTSKVSSILHDSEKYQELTIDSIPHYLSNHAPNVMTVLGTTSFVDLDCSQVEGDDLNLVFVVTNSINGKKVVVKQALPYVKTAAESWPVPLKRALYEYTALKMQRDACPQNVPYVYYFSQIDAVIVMEHIPLSCIVLRQGLIGGVKFKTMAADMGSFVANALFKSSGFKLSAAELRQQVKFWSNNTSMCAIAERCVFTEPYIDAANNWWTTPHLDDYKKAIENDSALKLAAAKMKHKFVTKTEALLHADLHTDSVLCSPEGGQTFAIGPRFSFYGPMAFDVGAFIANLLLSYVSQGGHSNEEGYDEWILEQLNIFWKTFRKEFLRLWDDQVEHTGYKFQKSMFGEDKASYVAAQEEFLAELLSDALGFAGMKMLKRIVGSNHVEDLESIADINVRAKCEIHGLEIAFCLIKNSRPPNSIDDVIGLAREKKPE